MGLYKSPVVDSLRGITLGSIKDAWMSYHPEMKYQEFYYILRAGGFKHLHIGTDHVVVEPNPDLKKQVRDAETDKTWASVCECARDLGVSRTCIQLTLKRKGRCRGHLLEWAEL